MQMKKLQDLYFKEILNEIKGIDKTLYIFVRESLKAKFIEKFDLNPELAFHIVGDKSKLFFLPDTHFESLPDPTTELPSDIYIIDHGTLGKYITLE